MHARTTALIGVASIVPLFVSSLAEAAPRRVGQVEMSLRGAVVAFDRTDCPRGWQEVVALRGRQIVGASPPGAPDNGLPAYGLDKDYGTSTVSLSVDQLPAHAHTYKDIFFAESGSPPTDPRAGYEDVPGRLGSARSDDDNRGEQMLRRSDETGGGAPIPIQPPARALLFCKHL